MTNTLCLKGRSEHCRIREKCSLLPAVPLQGLQLMLSVRVSEGLDIPTDLDPRVDGHRGTLDHESHLWLMIGLLHLLSALGLLGLLSAVSLAPSLLLAT